MESRITDTSQQIVCVWGGGACRVLEVPRVCGRLPKDTDVTPVKTISRVCGRLPKDTDVTPMKTIS